MDRAGDERREAGHARKINLDTNLASQKANQRERAGSEREPASPTSEYKFPYLMCPCGRVARFWVSRS